MLSRVEGMSEEALAAGVPFAGGSMGDFLDGLEGRIGVNVLAYVGHCGAPPLRDGRRRVRARRDERRDRGDVPR